MDGTGHHMQFSILSSFETVGELAEKVSGACATWPSATKDDADILRICIAEALNNIVEHAYGGATGQPIMADVRLQPDGYEVLLIDEGKPMPKGIAPTGQLDYDGDDLDNLPEGGFGWMLIRSQMDIVDYQRQHGCNVLRLERRFPA